MLLPGRPLGVNYGGYAAGPTFAPLPAPATPAGGTSAWRAPAPAPAPLGAPPSPARFDCSDLAGWKQSWSYEQKDWCCQHESTGCYDCTGDPRYWGYDRRLDCCRSQGIACSEADTMA